MTRVRLFCEGCGSYVLILEGDDPHALDGQMRAFTARHVARHPTHQEFLMDLWASKHDFHEAEAILTRSTPGLLMDSLGLVQ